MRLVFAGTPDAAVPALQTLAASAHDVVGVITRPDAPTGRKRVLTPSPVAIAAAGLGIETLHAATLDDAATARVRAWEPDLGVVVAYGGLVREPLLSLPGHGWINLHFSLLPTWRGAAPVQRALIAGDEETGVSVFQLVPALDAGDVFTTVRIGIPPHATAGELLSRLAVDGAGVLRDTVDRIADGTARAVPQSGETSYAHKLDIADGALDWSEAADRVLARFRGVTPEPGAHTTVAGSRVKILDAGDAERAARLAPGRIVVEEGDVLIGTATEPILVRRLQPAGRGAMAAADWFRGLRADDPVAGS